MTHTCHLPGCATPSPPRWLFCPEHWGMVPKDIQREVYRTVSLRDLGSINATWAPWWRAQAEATFAVLLELGADCPKHLDKDLAFANQLESAA